VNVSEEVSIRRLTREELPRLAELDRSEHVTTAYRCRDGRLEAYAVDWRVPPWEPDGDHEHTVASHRKLLEETLDAGGVVLGAFAGDELAGVGGVKPGLTETQAQLSALWVSRQWRRRHVARALAREAYGLARAGGAREIYVSATPSESAVSFYLSEGFRPTDSPHPDLLAAEPEDIQMTRPL
jgi:GNAT superfamily N-acetyltransferase